ncbi:DUF7662 domain-containing protein [Kurthia sibirica]|uniref:DUF7662 domain-containing protein n=1 Tax=Kurthia sibirica TaxID=202750 RepID=A0A2U3AKJ1_9BACL|nr:hypothetical protein [Kurthia sibirica]PWI25050.1 hypothetical protein DEX24_09900 [Kurthia sibirica]GEK34214.1 hypothetical protein KSI01_17470 [Kurthia sibirica]
MTRRKFSRKYYPLFDYLSKQVEDQIILSFDQVEQIINNKLPKSAYTYQAWWGNTRSGTYVQSAAWLEAGFRVETIQFGHSVEFNRVSELLLTKKRHKSAVRIPPILRNKNSLQ